MLMKRAAVTTFVAFLVFAPAAALAHTGHDDASGLAHGFVHPMTGIDHILAMVAVGLLVANMAVALVVCTVEFWSQWRLPCHHGWTVAPSRKSE
jgi:hydrogenase/urease accessory protein HupE